MNIKSIFTIVAVLFFYTGIPVYLYTLGYSLITTLFWIGLFGVSVLITLVLKYFAEGNGCKIDILNPLLCWAFFFIEINVLWYLFSNQSEIVSQVFRRHLLSIIFFALFYLMLYDDGKLQTKVRWVLFLSTLLAIINNIYDLIVPFSFVPLLSEYSNPGRAAGFYINANEAGCALVLGMIFSVGLLAKKYRILYVFLILIGILFTFSRAALLGWFIVMLILMLQNVLSKKHFSIGLGIFVLFISLTILLLPGFVQPENGVNTAIILERVDWILDPIGIQEISAQERRQVLDLSWEMFTDHPLIGNGLGSTESWCERASTHNMYLYFMADHGIIGVLILPLFCMATVWRAQGEALQIAIPFVMFILFFGLFSHNVTDDYCTLICFAIMAAMTISSRFKKVQPA